LPHVRRLRCSLFPLIAPTALALVATSFPEGPARNRWRSTPTVRGALLAAFLVGAFLLQIGSALGVTALMAVATAVTSSHSVPGEGYRAALAVAGGLAAVAFVVSAAFVGTRRAGEPSLTLPAGRRELRRCAAGTPS